MDALTLLDEAHAAGLSVRSDGERLVVRGPKQAEPIALRLLDAKPDVMAVLVDNEVEHLGWDEDTAELVRWFLTAAPPAEPFELCRGVTILDPARWWRSIRSDIETGPTGPRARYGALQGNLRKLHILFAVRCR